MPPEGLVTLPVNRIIIGRDFVARQGILARGGLLVGRSRLPVVLWRCGVMLHPLGLPATLPVRGDMVFRLSTLVVASFFLFFLGVHHTGGNERRQKHRKSRNFDVHTRTPLHAGLLDTKTLIS